MNKLKSLAAIVIIAAISMCGVGCGQTETLREENEALREENSELSSELREVEARNDKQSERLRELESENADMRNEVFALEEMMAEGATEAAINLDEAVWIGASGTKYHREDCMTLSGSNKKQITLRKALQMGKEPCAVCIGE